MFAGSTTREIKKISSVHEPAHFRDNEYGAQCFHALLLEDYMRSCFCKIPLRNVYPINRTLCLAFLQLFKVIANRSGFYIFYTYFRHRRNFESKIFILKTIKKSSHHSRISEMLFSISARRRRKNFAVFIMVIFEVSKCSFRSVEKNRLTIFYNFT